MRVGQRDALLKFNNFFSDRIHRIFRIVLFSFPISTARHLSAIASLEFAQAKQAGREPRVCSGEAGGEEI